MRVVGPSAGIWLRARLSLPANSSLKNFAERAWRVSPILKRVYPCGARQVQHGQEKQNDAPTRLCLHLLLETWITVLLIFHPTHTFKSVVLDFESESELIRGSARRWQSAIFRHDGTFRAAAAKSESFFQGLETTSDAISNRWKITRAVATRPLRGVRAESSRPSSSR